MFQSFEVGVGIVYKFNKNLNLISFLSFFLL
jgi:hypothetical protein